MTDEDKPGRRFKEEPATQTVSDAQDAPEGGRRFEETTSRGGDLGQSKTPQAGVASDSKTKKASHVWSWLGFVAGVILWIYSISVIETADLSRMGLVGALPIAYFLALLAVAGSFVSALVSKKPPNLLLGLNVLLLIVIIHATIPAVFPEARYVWAYKHFGVTEHIMDTGKVDPTVDIYQNWPGFFAVTAWFGEMSGLGVPRNYAAWAQLFNNVVAFPLLAFIFRSLTSNVRVIWLATFFFFSASWVAQDYFAPQALVFVLTLGVYGIILKWLLNPAPRGLLYRIASKIFIVRKRGVVVEATSPWRVVRYPGSQATWALAAAALVFYSLTASHQLTPYLVLCGVGALMLMSQLKEKATFFLLAAVAFVYLLPHLPFVQEQYGVFSNLNPLSNAREAAVDQVSQSPMMALVAIFARALSAVAWILGVAGFFRGLFQGRRDFIAAILMVAPFAVIAGQSYGGEAIYRVYLFSLPFASFLAARFLLPKMKRAVVLRFLRPFIPIVLCLTLMMPAYFGLESVNEVSTGEADASAWFYETAPRGSLLVAVVASFPMRSKGTYDEYQLPSGGDFAPSLSTYPDFDEFTGSTERLQGLLENTMRVTEGTEKFVVLSRGQQRSVDMLDIGPPTMVADLENSLNNSANWQEVYSNPEARLYRFTEAPAPS